VIYDEFEPRGSLQVSETEAIELIENWLRQDRMRMQALECVANLGPIDAWLAAGFVRNLVWDKLHGTVSRLSDIDVIYFEPSDHSEVTDRAYEAKLVAALDLPWSVKNQARMHLKNNHQPYVSVSDAMSYWPEQQTALAVRLRAGELQLLNLFPLSVIKDSVIKDSVIKNSITRNIVLGSHTQTPVAPLFSLNPSSLEQLACRYCR